MILPVYILIRTSCRPKFFACMMDSIKKQTYKNIVTIVHSDNPEDKYVEGDIIINGEFLDETHGTHPFNLYCNRLLDAIPDGPGWYHFIDDDDMYAHETSIEQFVRFAKPECINVGRVMRWKGRTFPRMWGNDISFHTECFMLHTNHKNKARWYNGKAADHDYSEKLTRILKTNWIDNLMVCVEQEDKGYGKREDKKTPPQAEAAKLS